MTLIVLIVRGIIWGFATNAVLSNKGYSDNWFLWGFFFGIIPFIVALTKPNNYSYSNYSSYDDNDSLYGSRTNNTNASLFGDKSQEVLRQDGWTCTCGRVNAAYIGTCACGKTKSEVIAAQNKTSVSKDEEQNVEALREYKKLLDEGILTQEEFDLKKKELLRL